jgi:hypothetical protein
MRPAVWQIRRVSDDLDIAQCSRPRRQFPNRRSR